MSPLPARSRTWLCLAVAFVTVGCADIGTSVPEDGPAGADSPTSASPSPNEPEAEVAAIGEQLCQLASVAADDPVGAAGSFDHQPLHAIADELAETDRAAGGRLLEAKARAETVARDAAPDAKELSNALADLAAELPNHEGCDL